MIILTFLVARELVSFPSLQFLDHLHGTELLREHHQKLAVHKEYLLQILVLCCPSFISFVIDPLLHFNDLHFLTNAL